MEESRKQLTPYRMAPVVVAVCLITLMVTFAMDNSRTFYKIQTAVGRTLNFKPINSTVNVMVDSESLLEMLQQGQQTNTTVHQGKAPPPPKVAQFDSLSSIMQNYKNASPIYMWHTNHGARLGNKLWQLAAGLQLSAQNRRPLYVSAGFQKFLKAVLKMENNGTYFIGTAPKGTKVASFERDARARTCDALWIDELFHLSSEPVLVEGYFQCKRFLVGIEADLRRLFTVREEYQAKARLILDQISVRLNLTNPQFIGVHVRRGDLLRPRQRTTYRVAEASYFYKAMAHFRQKYGPSVHFVVASDSADWCRKTFANITDVSIPNKGRELDFALLVATNHHIIIGMSTFSFWAAWLGGSQAEVIYFNKPFFNESRNMAVIDNFYLDHWMPMGN